MSKRYDVIGSDLRGLTAAGLLARAGRLAMTGARRRGKIGRAIRHFG